MAPARPGTPQRAWEDVAKGIKKSPTYIRRHNRRPRGLQNLADTCYRNAALQALLHLPRFVNWIMQHNAPLQNWPCDPKDPNQVPVDITWRNEPAILNLGDGARGCVPCLFKQLVRGYWGKVLTDPEIGPPALLTVDHENFLPLQQLSKRWYLTPIENIESLVQGKVVVWKEDMRKARQSVTKEGESSNRRSFRLDLQNEKMDGQQDSDEYAKRILVGVENTIRGNTPAARKRRSQFTSLFTRIVRVTRTCEVCGHDRGDVLASPQEYRIHPLHPGQPDNIAAAMDRANIETLDLDYPVCKIKQTYQCVSRNITAPEYLWVVSSVLAHNGKDYYKNRNPIDISEVLDITSHMTYGDETNVRRVRYGLQHIVYHAGASLNAGHYAAAVTGMAQLGGNRQAIRANKFFCDDSTIDEFTSALMPAVANVGNMLTVNPVLISKPEDKKHDLERTPFDPSYLIYVRLDDKKEPNRTTGAATGAVIPVVGTIADNVKKSPRIRRKPTY